MGPATNADVKPNPNPKPNLNHNPYPTQYQKPDDNPHSNFFLVEILLWEQMLPGKCLITPPPPMYQFLLCLSS